METKESKDLDRAIEWAEKKLSPMNPATYSRDYGFWSGLHDARNIMRPGAETLAKMGEGKPEAEKPSNDPA